MDTTKNPVIPGGAQGFFCHPGRRAAETRDPRSGGSARASFNRVPGRVDSHLTGMTTRAVAGLSMAVNVE